MAVDPGFTSLEDARRRHTKAMVKRRIAELKGQASKNPDDDRKQVIDGYLSLGKLLEDTKDAKTEEIDWKTISHAMNKMSHRIRKLRASQKLTRLEGMRYE
jgi:hypothetical protein